MTMKSYFKIWKPIENNQAIQYHAINNYFDNVVHSEILEITLKLYDKNEFVKLVLIIFVLIELVKIFMPHIIAIICIKVHFGLLRILIF